MQRKVNPVSTKTSQRWWLVALLTILGIFVLASSVYFLISPVGYQGGRNPNYGITLIFDRETWDTVHLWTGLGMILILTIHIVVHWKWIQTMLNRYFLRDVHEVRKLNWRAQVNIILDLTAALSFILASVSGIYLLFAPARSSAATAPVFIFNWYAWDIIHTWSGIVMFISVFLHLYIHWGWIINVTKRVVIRNRSNSNQLLKGLKSA